MIFIYFFQIGEIWCVLSFSVEMFFKKSLKYFQFTRFYPMFQQIAQNIEGMLKFFFTLIISYHQIITTSATSQN
jgi:hypothetical protein